MRPTSIIHAYNTWFLLRRICETRRTATVRSIVRQYCLEQTIHHSGASARAQTEPTTLENLVKPLSWKIWFWCDRLSVWPYMHLHSACASGAPYLRQFGKPIKLIHWVWWLSRDCPFVRLSIRKYTCTACGRAEPLIWSHAGIFTQKIIYVHCESLKLTWV